MANDEHVAKLKQGVSVWNAWRVVNPGICPDLGGADLSGANLSGADLRSANLIEANLPKALIGADLSRADLSEADLSGANLNGANLRKAELLRARLGGANLSNADLQAATLVDTDLTGADLTGCRIYGASAWSLKLEGTKQQNLVITQEDEPEITVDNIEVAQFVYLLLHNEKFAMSSIPLERRACSCWADSPRAGLRFWSGCGKNSESGATCRSFSTSTSPKPRTSLRL